jgi:hypothetical protein
MTRVAVTSSAVGAAAEHLGVTSGAFSQGAGRVGGTPGAAAPHPSVQALLERVLEAIADSLGKAAAELDGMSAGLGATAVSYERTEQLLANWHVPGETA